MSQCYDDDSLLPLSGIEHLVFCERQWALIHIENQWLENVRTVEGHHMHDRAHNPLLVEDDGDHIVTRAVPLISRRLGLTGQADVVEFWRVDGNEGRGVPLAGHEGLWLPKPVEYKRGRPKPDDRDEVQVCAQAICLEEMLGVRIAMADLYYGETRRREKVAISDQLRARVEYLCVRMHQLFDAGVTPPAGRGRHCSLCSLVDVCVPGITLRSRSVRAYICEAVSTFLEDDQ